MRRELWADVGRGVSILAIVLFHFLIWVYLPGMKDRNAALLGAWETVAEITASFRLSLLFVISGYLIGPRLRRGFADRKNLLRVATNAWLCVVWLAIFALCSLLIKPGMPLRISSVESFFTQLVLPRTTLWFIVALVVWAFIVAALHRVPAAVMLSATFVLSSSTWLLPRGPGDMYVQVLYYGFFFAAGVYLVQTIRWLATRPPVVALPMMVGFALLAAVVLPWLEDSGLPLPRVLSVLGDAAVVAAAIPGVALLALVPVLGRVLGAIGRNALPIYLMQLPILWAVIMVRPRMPWANEAFQVIAPFVGLAGTVLVALALYWLAMRTPAAALFTLPTALDWTRADRTRARGWSGMEAQQAVETAAVPAQSAVGNRKPPA
jgi:fucose 4-O-acetylase-like acetyltransferase